MRMTTQKNPPTMTAILIPTMTMTMMTITTTLKRIMRNPDRPRSSGVVKRKRRKKMMMTTFLSISLICRKETIRNSRVHALLFCTLRIFRTSFAILSFRK